MKIALFSETFFPQTNGVSTSLDLFTRELIRQGHEVEIFTSKDKRPYTYEAAIVHRFKSITFKPYPDFSLPVFPVTSKGIVKKGNFDIIHSNSPFSMGWAAIYSAKAAKIPLVSTFHTPLDEYTPYIFGKGPKLNYLGKKMTWTYCRKHYKASKAIITPSEAVKQLLTEKGFKQRMEVIPTGVELDRFDSVKMKRPIKGKYILHTGRISIEKRVDTVVKAFPLILEKHPDINLVITSEGPTKKKMIKLAEELGISNNVQFTGFLPWDELVNYYSFAECAILASGAETQGLVMLEEMACYTPVVAADFLAIPETVRNGYNGYLFELGNHQQLADNVTKILDDSKLQNKLSINARKTAEENNIERRTTQLVEFYESVI